MEITQPSNMLKVICFDLDGVYFSPIGKKKFDEYLGSLGLSLDGIKDFYWSDEMRKFVRGQISTTEFCDFFRSYTNTNLTDEQIAEQWIAGYEINPEVRDIVLQVRALGYKTCVCTNNNKLRLDALRARFPEFASDFDVIVSSHEVGDAKPSKVIFEKLIEKSEVAANEILYSDDNAERLQGAQELGIATVVVHTPSDLVGALAGFGIIIKQNLIA